MKAPFKFRWRGEERRRGGGEGGEGRAREDEKGAGAPAETHFIHIAATVCQKADLGASGASREIPRAQKRPPATVWDGFGIISGRMRPGKGGAVSFSYPFQTL